MTLLTLRDRLQEEGFSPSVYSLDQKLPPYEGLVLRERSGKWVIEHCERGMCRELEILGSEHAACERMYELLSMHFR